MSKAIHYQKVRAIFRVLKPWLITFALVVILRFTGALSGISFLAQSAIFETGLMDAKPTVTDSKPASFDYNFVVKDIQGNKVEVSQFKNKVIFLNLWATWCGPCRVEMPSIQNLYNQVDKDKVVFLMLSLDNEENHHKIVQYIKDKEFSFPVYTPHEFIPSQLKVSMIPATFIIGKDGKIKDKKIGAANYDSEKFVKYINGLAGE